MYNVSRSNVTIAIAPVSLNESRSKFAPRHGGCFWICSFTDPERVRWIERGIRKYFSSKATTSFACLCLSFLCSATLGCTEHHREHTTAESVEHRPSAADSDFLYFVATDDSEIETRDSLRDRRGWVLIPTPPANTLNTSLEDPHLQATEKFRTILASCEQCHSDYQEYFLQTAHAKTSFSAELKRFEKLPPREGLKIPTRLAGFDFLILQHDHGIEQIVEIENNRDPIRHGELVDVIVGSGKYGQSFLYWKRNRLYQLPISYLSYQQQWTLSPGYRDGTADFARPVIPRCLDCHTTNAVHVSGTINGYDRDATIWGLHCVRCHGDVAGHVSHHRHNPDAVTGEQIVRLGSLSANRLNELCAQCHSGGGELLKPPYTYRPGDPLNEYIKFKKEDSEANGNDPHSANQFQRLKKSKCFQNSKEMTCLSCHNPHRHERNQPVIFANRCLSCHADNNNVCPEQNHLKASHWKSNCISCHMPKRTAPNTFSELKDSVSTPKLRDHRIGIWPKLSREIRDAVDSFDGPNND